MSRLTRMLSRNIKEMQGSSLSLLEKVQEKIDNSSFIIFFRDWYYSFRAFFINLPMFLRFAWGYRAWDYTYNIGIFITLLETTAKNIRDHGHALNSEKCARRAFTAAGMLRKAYIDDVANKTHTYLYDKYGYSFMDDYKKPPPELERRIKRMKTIAAKREQKEERELQEAAWKYVHKYIQNFWD